MNKTDKIDNIPTLVKRITSQTNMNRMSQIFGFIFALCLGGTSGLVGIIILPGCDAPQTTTTTSKRAVAANAALSRPEAISRFEDYILVANTNYHFPNGKISWKTGYVSVFSASKKQYIGTVEVETKNPIEFFTTPEAIHILSAGENVIDAKGIARPTSNGSISRIIISDEKITLRDTVQITSDNPEVGSFGTIIQLNRENPTETMWALGSGTSGTLALLPKQPNNTASDSSELRPLLQKTPTTSAMSVINLWPDNDEMKTTTNNLVKVFPYRDGMIATSYNRDEICIWQPDPQLHQMPKPLERKFDCLSVGINEDLLEGLIDIAHLGSHLFLLMSNANRIYHLNINTGKIDHEFAKTGLAPNRIVLHGETLYVVNSHSDSIQAIEIDFSQNESATIINQHELSLEIGSGPFDMVFSGKSEAWVSLHGTNEVVVIDFDADAVTHQFSDYQVGDNTRDVKGDKTSDVEAFRTNDKKQDEAKIIAKTDPISCNEESFLSVSSIASFDPGKGAGYGQKNILENISGAPDANIASSSTDTNLLSLGSGGTIVLDFSKTPIIDGPGVDFGVFENPFSFGDDQVFAEPAEISVSNDGIDFYTFPCEHNSPYLGCAGKTPTRVKQGSCIDISTSGGDWYDLKSSQLEKIRYIRITDIGASTMGVDSQGFDLDAVLVRQRDSERELEKP